MAAAGVHARASPAGARACGGPSAAGGDRAGIEACGVGGGGEGKVLRHRDLVVSSARGVRFYRVALD